MDKVVSKDGTEIAYERSGDGPPIIVVGGATADHLADIDLAAALSAAGFTAIIFDRRGRGESGDTLPYEVRREVEDIEALIDVAGGSAYLWGQSSGGALSLIAAASGAPVTGVAVIEPPYRVAADAPPAPERYVETLDELISTGRRGDALGYFMTDAVGQPAEEVEQMRQLPFWGALEAIAHTLAYDGRIMGDNQPPVDVLARISVPTLAIDSNGSPNWLRAAAEAAAKAVPNAEHRSLDGTFHTVAPEVLVPVLKKFFLG